MAVEQQPPSESSERPPASEPSERSPASEPSELSPASGAPGAEDQSGAGRGLSWILAALVAVVIAGGVALLLAGKGGSGKSAPEVSASAFAGSVASPPEQAPPLQLRNYRGEEVNIASYRGKAALVTFIYTHCPDVCPLITANLRVAQGLLGAQASKAQIIAVSVDSRGDTPKTVAIFLAAHRMTGRMQYLIGSQRELARVWKAWGIGSERDAHSPQLVEHTGLVYGISASGKITTLYPANFKPAEIAHDVPLLTSR
jgi:protein SCO1/2